MSGGAWTPYTSGAVSIKVSPNPAVSITLYAFSSENCIGIHWTDPAEDKIDEATGLPIKWSSSVLVRKQGSVPMNINDGTQVVSTTDKDQYRYSPYKDYNVVRGITYYYAVFTISESGIPSDTAPSDSTKLELYGINPTKNLNATRDILSGEVTFTWEDPEDEANRDKWAYTELRYYETESTSGLKPTGGTLITTSRVHNQYRYSGFTTDVFKRQTMYKIVAWAFGESGKAASDTGLIYSLYLENPSTGAVTNFVASSKSDGIYLTWQDPSDNQWDRTIIRRKEGSYPTSENDGDLVVTEYVKNQYRSNAYVDSYPASHRGTTYYYAAFAISQSDEAADPAKATGSVELYTTGPVLSFAVDIDGIQSILTWQDPIDNTNTQWGRTVIVRNSSGYPTSPSDGTIVITSSSRDQYRYDGFIDGGVAPGYTYYYSAFTYSIDDVLCDQYESSSIFIDIPSINPTTDMICTINSSKQGIDIRWVDPDDSIFDHTVLVRSTSGYPGSPLDGIEIARTTYKNQYKNSPYTDSNVEDNRTYYYTAFAYSKYGNFADNNAQGSVMYTTYKVMTVTVNTMDPSFPSEYLDDAIGMSYGDDDAWIEFFGCRPCVVLNGNVLGYLNPDDFTKTVDGGNSSDLGGQYMIEFPRRGIRLLENISGNYTFQLSITDDPNRSGFDYGIFNYNGEQKDAIYISAYLLDDNGESKPSRYPQSYTSAPATESSYKINRNFGSDSAILYYNHWSYLSALYLMMYTYHLPAYNTNNFGDVSNTFRGYADTKGMCSTVYGKGLKMFGLESFLSRNKTAVGGIEYSYGTINVKETIGSDFSEITVSSTNQNGFITEVFTKGNLGKFFPTASSGGSSTTFYKSYAHTSNSGGRMLIVGSADPWDASITPLSVSDISANSGAGCGYRAVCYCN